jgi:hypothetical protein
VSVRRSRVNDEFSPALAGIPRASKFYDPLADAARLGTRRKRDRSWRSCQKPKGEMFMTVSKATPEKCLFFKSINRLRGWLRSKPKSPPKLLNHAVHAEHIKRQRIDMLLVPAGQPLEHGQTYLKLLHGRNRVDENLDDWGFSGPTFGPLDWFHITYLHTFRFGRDNVDAEIATVEDMFVWDGKYYGDAEIFRFKENNTRPLTKPEYSIGVHNDDGDCYDIVIKQKGRPIATLIATEAEVQPLVHAGNCYAGLVSALRAADTAIIEVADLMLYEDDKPVTFLESSDIERAYYSLVEALPEIKHAFNVVAKGRGGSHA